ncbi:MAG TPA: hypothetical protein VH276_09545 [Solirubrobacteraceae bacterium]|jgi:hypothetical protein|nr:hypothetical protein [Solirubrobacteraceae bacterium]
MSITRTLAAAFAIVALGASAAQAQPLDPPASTATPATKAQQLDMHASTAVAAANAQHKQDLRSADARDAVRNPRNVDVTPRPTHDAPTATVDTDSGVDWTAIAIGSAMGLLAIGGLAGLNSVRMRRLHRPRTVA